MKTMLSTVLRAAAKSQTTTGVSFLRRGYLTAFRQIRTRSMMTQHARYFSTQDLKDQYEVDPYEAILKQSVQDQA